MRQGVGETLTPAAERLLAQLATSAGSSRAAPRPRAEDIAALIAADLVVRRPGGQLAVTRAGYAHLARRAAARIPDLDPYLAQHIEAAPQAEAPLGAGSGARMNAAESPLVWLARRKGRDGAPLIAPEQLQAGERLRAEFTRAQLMPRVTSSWNAVGATGRRGGGGAANIADTVIAARQRVRHALDAAGPEFAGLLLDVCCFLKGLDDVERERHWPARSAKVVLQLGLDRLARHYGFEGTARGRARVPLRVWWAEEEPVTDGEARP